MQILKMPTVLICGHNNRDRRCGVLGPLLRNEFQAWTNPGGPNSEVVKMTRKTKRVERLMDSAVPPEDWTKTSHPAQVGLVSHIGGHAWAGNVIVYLPSDHRVENDTVPLLAGKGIWYGRVEPRHVEGIINETIRKGRIIGELLRGVHGE